MLINRRRFFASTSGSALTACAGFLVCAAGCGEKPEEKSPPADPTKPVRFTAKLRARGKGHESWPLGVAVSPDGKTAVTSGDKALRFWSIPDAKQVRTIQVIPPENSSGATGQVLFFRDGKQVAAVIYTAEGNRLGFWNVETGKQVPHPIAEERWSSIAISRDGTTFAVGGRKGVQVWDLTQSKKLREYSFDRRVIGSAISLAFSDDGTKLAAAFGEGKAERDKRTEITPLVRVWELKTGKEVFKGGEQGRPHMVAFSPDGQVLAAACTLYNTTDGDDDPRGGVWLWALGSGKLLHTLRADKHVVFCLAFHPGGRMLASGGNEAPIKVWDVATGKLAGRLDGHTDQVTALTFLKDGTTLLSVGRDKELLVWEVEQK